MATQTASLPRTTEGKRAQPVGLIALTVFTALMLLAASYMAFIYAPTEATMGAVQRIFYFHVGAAWAGALAFLVTVVAGVLYLIKGTRKWDIVGLSSVEVGLALITITLASGPVWAQFAWGKPWTWDPKLTASAVMWLSYAAYLMLRQGIEDPTRRARFGAVYGIIAFASVIMVFFGVRYINATIHPVVIGQSASTAEGDFGMTARMLHAMLFSFVTFTFVFATLLWHRIRLERLSDRVDAIKARLLTR
ncbi:MAG TPA: cytochrome c biogenesis protein CcsA [Aggregatilineales bacterium]|nr:cytochrome c biogenesis protein CcsA [Aggregatilineales bacterium]